MASARAHGGSSSGIGKGHAYQDMCSIGIIILNPEGGATTTNPEIPYQHLEPRPGSNYRQLFLKGRRIRAAVVDQAIHGPDPFTPEEY